MDTKAAKMEVKNENTKDIIKNTLRAAIGLALFGVGTYFTIQANIGVAPWDCFYLGIEKTTGIKYGNISVCTSLIIIIVDVLLKERIGIGTLTDAVVVGKTVDLCNALELVPEQNSMTIGVVCMLAGLLMNGIGQYIYMRAALCCGPRDSLLLALSKRMPRIPIGGVGVMINGAVLLLGWILGGPIGVGTIIGVLLMTPVMQMVFEIMRFDPKAVKHQNMIQSFRVIFSRKDTSPF